MRETPVKAWICSACGYIHYGDVPPEECPICGAERELFEPYLEPEPAAAEASAASQRYIVIGAGVAGVSAAEALRKADPQGTITLLSAEKGLPYTRMNLTRYLAGELRADQLALHPSEWYLEQGIDLRSGVVVEEIDLQGKTVLAGGERLPFDRLVLAAGANPFVPPIPGTGQPQVTTLRTRADADRILQTVREKAARGEPARVVCIGGGILGLETAGALACQDAQVTVVENQPWLLSRQLNRRGGEVFLGYLKMLGIEVAAPARTIEIAAPGGGSAAAVTLEDGRSLPADLVVISAGVRSNVDLARRAGLKVNQGVVVDERMRASHPDVFAAGDIAEFNGLLYGLWAPAQAQGAVAGRNAAGSEASFSGPPRSTTLKVLGIDLFGIGAVNDPADVVVEDALPAAVPLSSAFPPLREGRKYHAFFFKDARMVAAILLGGSGAAAPARLAALVKKAVEEKVDFSSVLAGNPGPAEIVAVLGAAGF